MVSAEESYGKEFNRIQTEAKKISDVYESENPNCEIKFQVIPSGYRDHEYRMRHKYNWYKKAGTSCPRCDKTGTNSETKLFAGCGMGGDGYGSRVVFCTHCGLFDYSSYDEA